MFDTYSNFMKLNKYKNISIYAIFRNNQKYISNMILMLKNLERENYQFYNYFYENDSFDNTKHQLLNYIKYNIGKVRCEDLKKKQYNGGILKQRFINLSEYRNKSKKLSKDLFMTEWSLILDSNIYFNKNIINNLLFEYYKLNDSDIAMINSIWK